MSKALYFYAIKAALRDRLVRVVVILFAIISALSMVMGDSAVLEGHSFILVFAGSSIRLAAILGVILFVCFYIRRSFATREIDFLLSRPISREQFVISHAFAFITIALLLTFFAFVAMIILNGFKFHMGLLCWTAGLFIEIALMANLAMFFSMVLSSAVASFAASFGFYVLARMTGAIFGTIDGERGNAVFQLMEYIMQAISVILPRLDLIVQSSWLIYGIDDFLGDFIYMGIVSVCFSVFIILATMIDLKRKEF